MILPRFRHTLLFAAFAITLLGSVPQDASGQTVAVRTSSAYEKAAGPLRTAPSRTYEFSQARLTDVLRLMAKDAGINFLSLPGDKADSSRLITFTMEASPFTALEILSEENGIALVYNASRALWSLKPSNSSELIPRTYRLNHSTKEKITVNSSSGGGATGGGASQGGQGGGMTTGINLQGETQVFEVEESLLIEEVKEILGIPTTSGSLLTADAYLNAVSGLGSNGGGTLTPMSTNLVQNDASSGAKVMWIPDANSLYVLATAIQHQWVREYLEAVDRPQNLIAVEVKFFETTKDPRRQVGLDWSGTLGDKGLGFGLSNLTNDAVDLNHLSSLRAPSTAVLSASDLDVRLRALLTDSETRQVSYPRVLALNNKEVVIRSVVNQPVLAASSSTSPGAGSTTQQSVQYLPIGTVINILPRQMQDDAILLNVQLTISSIIGEKIIAGNPYPIASSRVYNSPLEVKSGYTVAIAGLDEALNSNSSSSVPVLSRLPVLGELFSNRGKVHSRKNLMMFITPTLLRSQTEGINEKPKAFYKGFQTTASPRAAYEQMASEWSRELDLIRHTALEGQSTRDDYHRTKEIISLSAGRVKLIDSYRKTRVINQDEAAMQISALRAVNEQAQMTLKEVWMEKP